MKKKIGSFLFLVYCCCFFSVIVQGQGTISATGGNATGSGGSVSYTVGQVACQTLSGTTGTVTQGVQQPFEIYVVSGAKGEQETVPESPVAESSVYPNPTSGNIRLVVESSGYENMRFRLYDINGTLLQDKKIEGNETEISMSNLSPSVYFLKVIQNNQEVKTYKIIKK